MVVSMLFLLLLRFTAPVMVWVLIVGVLGAGAYGKHSTGALCPRQCQLKSSRLMCSKQSICHDNCSSISERFRCVSLSGIWHCYWEYDNYKKDSATISNIGFTTNFNVYLHVQETWLAFCESPTSQNSSLNVELRLFTSVVGGRGAGGYKDQNK